MRTFVCSILIGLSLTLAIGPAHADPEIGQAEAAERRPITNFDTKGDDSVLNDCKNGNKVLAFSARIKAGTRGKFLRVGQSLARLELSTGEVIRDRGYTDPTRRRLAFLLYPATPSPTVKINTSANAFVKFTTNGAANVIVGQVSVICATYSPM